MTLRQLEYRIKRLPVVLPKWVDEAIEGNKEEILDRNRNQMEKLGEDSMGEAFGPYQDKEYQQYKALLGKESRFINLSFEGDFLKGMDIEVADGGVKIWSDDSKNDILVSEWGEEIFGLNDKNFDWLFEEVYEYLSEKLRTYFV